MDEKTMVNDILGSVKADLTAYQTAITEAENMQLRQTLQQIEMETKVFNMNYLKLLKQKDIINQLKKQQ